VAGARTYKELLIWQRGMQIVEAVYSMTSDFPKSEVYGLTSQIRRSAVSVPSNVAEGYGRKSNGSFVQFLRISMGSLYELETQLLLSERIGYISDKELLGKLLVMIDDESKMINTFIKNIGPSKLTS
jgi:four helix bundle protein